MKKLILLFTIATLSSLSVFAQFSRDLVTFRFISFPINYRLDTKFIYFATGFYLDYLVNISSEYNLYRDALGGEDRKFQFGVNTIAGIEKQALKKINIFMEARLFTNLTNSKEYQPLWGGGFGNYGLGVGANYKLLR